MKRHNLFTTVGAALGALALSAAVAMPANAGIQLWDGANYVTYLGDFGHGTSFVGSLADNRASSVRVTAPANYAILYQFANYGGIYTSKIYNRYDNLRVYTDTSTGVQFDNRTSSIG